MKYFTPELFIQGNSDDPKEVDRAEEEWERALKRYQRHYKKIESQLPESVRSLNRQYCLHDAVVVGPARLSISTLPWRFEDVVVVVQLDTNLPPGDANRLLFLQFALAAEPVVERPVESEVFQTPQPLWLYEEYDLVEPGVFSVEILLSDGRVIKLLFREFQWQTARPLGRFRAEQVVTAEN